MSNFPIVTPEGKQIVAGMSWRISTESENTYQELFNYILDNTGQTLLESEMDDIIKLCKPIIKEREWTLTIDKEPPFEAEIIFKNKAGNTFVGIRTHLTRGNYIKDRFVYIDFKMNKIRRNVVKWQFMPS